MKFRKEKSELFITLDQDLNLFTAKKILRLSKDMKKVHLDLQHTRVVDSEGMILIYTLLNRNIQLKISNPPEIFLRAMHVLDLDQVIPLDEII